MPRFAANLSFLFTELPFLERFGAAARAGFTAVEYLFPYDHAPDEIAAQLEAHKLEQVLFNLAPGDWAKGERGLACLEGREAALHASIATALTYARASGTTRLHLMAGLGDRRDGATLRRYEAALRVAAEALAQEGITLLIEPLNGRDMPGYLLDDVPFAAALIKETGLKNLRLQLDLYHAQILHGDITTVIERLLPMIGHIQIASVPLRHEPMRGEMHDAYLFALLDRLGYNGFIGCEYHPEAGTLEGLGWFAPYRRP